MDVCTNHGLPSLHENKISVLLYMYMPSSTIYSSICNKTIVKKRIETLINVNGNSEIPIQLHAAQHIKPYILVISPRMSS